MVFIGTLVFYYLFNKFYYVKVHTASKDRTKNKQNKPTNEQNTRGIVFTLLFYLKNKEDTNVSKYSLSIFQKLRLGSKSDRWGYSKEVTPHIKVPSWSTNQPLKYCMW